MPVRYNSKSSSTARFIAKIEDVLRVYERAYDSDYHVVCIDEKNKELRDHGMGREPVPPGPSIDKEVARDQREDHAYRTGGMANIFMVCEPLGGWRRADITEHRTARDFAAQLRNLVDQDFPAAKKVVLVTDNRNTHTMWPLYQSFEPQEAGRILDKIEWHYTPDHGSWLDMAEIELSAIQQQCLDRRIAAIVTLKREASAWEQQRNSEHSIINWQFTTAEARIKLKSLYPAIS